MSFLVVEYIQSLQTSVSVSFLRDNECMKRNVPGLLQRRLELLCGHGAMLSQTSVPRSDGCFKQKDLFYDQGFE